jgi:hypothetical protein
MSVPSQKGESKLESRENLTDTTNFMMTISNSVITLIIQEGV